MEGLEKKSMKWSSTASNFAGMATAVGVILGVYYTHQNHQEAREADRAEKIMHATIEDAGLLTSAEFSAYVEAQKTHRTTVEAVMLDYMEQVQGTILIYLPALAESDAQILRRIDLIETKLDTRELDPIELRLERMWRHMEQQASTDSARARHQEIMDAVQRINEERYKIPIKSGNRAQ